MRAGAAGPAHWGRWGAVRGAGAGAWRGPPAWGRPRPGRVGAPGRGSRRRIPPVAAGTRAGPCSQATSRARPPHPPRDTCPWILYPWPARPEDAFSGNPTSPQGCLPLATCAARGEENSEKGTRGASLGGGATGGDRTGSGCQSAGLCSAWAQWEHQLAELETFPPRGTTVRGRVTPRPDDPWDPRLVFQRGTFGRTGGFRSGSARPNSRGPNLNLGGGRGRGAGLEGPGPPPQLEDPLDRQTAVPAPRASFTFWEWGAVSLLFPPQPLLPPQCG
ncbi:uncharacterized protein LOC116809563 [Hylobates moloch]|uniref:uncharacterized protein LOC116809563 n=1 Tax=Hylobates moloch TaxID=81572 RepID=UPI0026755561|nr:uncharacterized protein LOC116809563 [Hylobates moloch]